MSLNSDTSKNQKKKLRQKANRITATSQRAASLSTLSPSDGAGLSPSDGAGPSTSASAEGTSASAKPTPISTPPGAGASEFKDDEERDGDDLPSLQSNGSGHSSSTVSSLSLAQRSLIDMMHARIEQYSPAHNFFMFPEPTSPRYTKKVLILYGHWLVVFNYMTENSLDELDLFDLLAIPPSGPPSPLAPSQSKSVKETTFLLPSKAFILDHFASADGANILDNPGKDFTLLQTTFESLVAGVLMTSGSSFDHVGLLNLSPAALARSQHISPFSGGSDAIFPVVPIEFDDYVSPVFRGRGARVPPASSTSGAGARSDVPTHLRVPGQLKHFGMCLLRTPLPRKVYDSLYALASFYASPVFEGHAYLSSDFSTMIRQLELTQKMLVFLVGAIAELISERNSTARSEASILLTSSLATNGAIDMSPLLFLPPSTYTMCAGDFNTDCGLMAISMLYAMALKGANLNPGLPLLRSLTGPELTFSFCY
jgi:hypothetical protein